MRFGFSLPHYGFSLGDGGPISFDAMAAWAKRAESVGFDSVWASDHFFYTFERYGLEPDPIASLEPLTALAGLAVVTDRVRLGTLVLCAPFRHPSIVAKMAATIDQLSDGRLDLGVGAGWLEREFEAFGFGFGGVGERFAALEETLEVLDALFSGAPAEMDGPTVALRGARLLPGPVQQPRVPIWVGGKGGPRLLDLAARFADGWNTVWRMNPDDYADRVAAVREACERAGRDPATFRLSVGLYSLVGEDERDYHALFERGRAAMPGGAIDGDSPERWRADTLSGTPDQAIEQIQRFAELGVEEIVVAPWVLPFAVPEPELVDRFAELVMAPVRAGA
jgi:probable F420-dependent oxidoreductase